MVDNSDIEVVQAFHEGIRSRNVSGLLELAAEDIRVGGGRGSSVGKSFFAEWVAHASLTLEPLRWFSRTGAPCDDGQDGVEGSSASTIVVEERAVWLSARSGREMGRMVFAAVYEVHDGVLASIARYNNVGEAVNTVGLDREDEVTVTPASRPEQQETS